MPNQVQDLPDGFAFVVNAREPHNMAVAIALPQKYVDRVTAWRESHPCTMREAWKAQVASGNTGAVLGGCFAADVSWHVTPSTVGCMVDVKCGCGAILEDVTEIARSW